MKRLPLEVELDNIAFDETKNLPRCDICSLVFPESSLTRWGKRTRLTEPIDLCPECLRTTNS